MPIQRLDQRGRKQEAKCWSIKSDEIVLGGLLASDSHMERAWEAEGVRGAIRGIHSMLLEHR